MKRALSVLLLFIMMLVNNASIAQSNLRTTESDLPIGVLSLLPARHKYITSRHGDGIYQILMDEGESVRRIWIFHDSNGGYQLECVSAPLPPIRESVATIESSIGGGSIFLFYEKSSRCATFTRNAEGEWLLSYIQGEKDIWVDAGWSSMNSSIDGYANRRFAYVPFERSLSAIDISRLPTSLEDIVDSADPQEYAVITANYGEHRPHLRTGPTQDADLIGTYYGGTPVQVLASLGEWCRVSISGVVGYMQSECLVYGYAMLDVKRESSKIILDLDTQEEFELTVFSEPNSFSGVVGCLTTIEEVYEPCHVLGEAPNGWYHILYMNGLSGYVDAKYFNISKL